MMLLSALLGCALIPSADPGEVCGDGVWSPLEVCDPAEGVYGPWCNADCTWQRCGDGVVGPDEGCEPPGLYGPCGPTCKVVSCGNGAIDTEEICLEPSQPLAVGVGAADFALVDADVDGDLDLLVAAPDGAWVWFNDRGAFGRRALVVASDSVVAVAALGRTLFALDAAGLTVAHWFGVGHQLVFYPHGVGVTGCTAPRPGSLSAGQYGITRTATWICDEGGMELFVDDRAAPARHDVGLGLAGAVAAFATLDNRAEHPRVWYGVPDDARLTSDSPPGQLVLPGPARAVRLPFMPDRQAGQLVVVTDAAIVVAEGVTASLTLPAPGVVDAAAAGVWDGVSAPDGAFGAAHLDEAGVVLPGARPAPRRGPNLPGLTRVLVGDLDLDGYHDLIALRPQAGELHIWMQRP